MIKIIKNYKIEILILLIFVLMRIPELGHDMFNTDVWKWKSRTYDFGSGIFSLNFDKTLQKYHPGVTLMWLGTAGVKINSFYHKVILGAPAEDNLIGNVFTLHTIQKTVIVVFLGLMMFLIYNQLKQLFGNRYALIAVTLMSLEPLYVALTRVMHLEGLMSTFMILSFIFLYRFFVDYRSRYLAWSAVFAALAILTKTSALFLIPFSALLVFIEHTKGTFAINKSVKMALAVFGKWLGLLILVFVGLWPVMYTNPILVFETLRKGIVEIGVETEHFQLFLGRWVDDPGYLFYIVVLLFRSSVTALLGMFGFFAISGKLLDSAKKRWFLLYCFVFVVFYTLELTLPTKKLDRYIIPTLLSIILVSSFLYEYAINYLFSKSKLLGGLLIIALLSYYGFTLSYLHPNYFSYYSPAFGGLRHGIYAIEPKWMIGQKEVVKFFSNDYFFGGYKRFGDGESIDEYINKPEMDEMLTVGFQEKYYTQIWPFISEIGGRATIMDISAMAEKTNFFVYPVYNDTAEFEDRFELEYMATVQLRGVDLYHIYRRVL